MKDSTAATRRKAICKSLAGVVRAGDLSARIDHHGFFMMLNANYEVLYRDGVLHLDPLYRALEPSFELKELIELFVRFERVLLQLGVEVSLPPQVAAIPEEVRRGPAHGPDEFDEELKTSEFMLMSEGEVAERMSLPLRGPGEAALLPPALRREVTQAAVNAVRQAPVGRHIDAAQFAFLVDSNFDQLCDGQRFDFQPILDGLREIPGLLDRDIFPAVVLLRQALRPMEIEVPDVPLDVDEADAVVLMHDIEARRTERQLRELRPSKDLPAPSESKPARAPARVIEPKPPEAARSWRPAALVTVLLCLLGFLAWTTLGGGVDPQGHEDSIPLSAARLESGAYIGTVDPSWWAVPAEERPDRLRRFTAEIRAEGHLPNLQLWDASGQLVVINQGKRLVGSKRFLTEAAP